MRPDVVVRRLSQLPVGAFAVAQASGGCITCMRGR